MIPTTGKSVFHSLYATALTLLLCTAPGAPGQEAEKKPAAARTLRVLPVGDPPPFRQEVRNGVRHELEAEPGTIPPRLIQVSAGGENSSLTLRLGRVSEAASLPPAAEQATLRLPAGNPQSPLKNWLNLRLPQQGDFLILIWRDPGKNWQDPRGMLLPDSAAGFPAGSLRVINLLPAKAVVTLDGNRILLEPGARSVRPLETGKDQELQISFQAPGGGEVQPFHHGSVLVNQGERAQLVIYRADGEKPRHPAKVLLFNELAPAAAGL